VPLFDTRDLAIYASIVGTLDGAWALYHNTFRDRPRITVKTSEGFTSSGAGRTGEVFILTVSNRGRRPVTIDTIARLEEIPRGKLVVLSDFLEQLAAKPRLEESQSCTFVNGQRGGYKHGALPVTRWFVSDGAGRIHPLRERYRQRALSLVLWPLRRYLRRRDRRTGSSS
jgi:hypothetical protein